MKKISLPFLIVISTSLYAQNPDGRNASLHITPLWNWGSANYSRSTYQWYPPTQASDEQTILVNDFGVLKHPYAFGISTSIKIPTTSFLTVNLSYAFNQDFEKYGTENVRQRYFGQFWSVNGSRHTMSVTLSVYNLFSVYQE